MAPAHADFSIQLDSTVLPAERDEQHLRTVSVALPAAQIDHRPLLSNWSDIAVKHQLKPDPNKHVRFLIFQTLKPVVMYLKTE